MLDQIKPLDFFVIGAQKAGTTSLYYYLKAHKEIRMHSSKELPFIVYEEDPLKQYQLIIEQFYAHAEIDKLWGAVAPHCMCDMRAPMRLKLLMPDGKIIALLRDPVDRYNTPQKLDRAIRWMLGCHKPKGKGKYGREYAKES